MGTCGSEVLFASRHTEKLEQPVVQAGSKASSGMQDQAARFGEAVLISVPFTALRELGRTLSPLLHGKVILETSNPYPQRDGAIAE